MVGHPARGDVYSFCVADGQSRFPSQQNNTALPPVPKRTKKCYFAHSLLFCTWIKNRLKLLDWEHLAVYKAACGALLEIPPPCCEPSEKLLYWFPKLRLPIIFPVKARFSVTFCKGKPWGSFQWAIGQVLCTFSFLSLSTGADSSNGLTRCHPDISGCVPVTFCGYWGVIQFQGNLRLIYPFDTALLL